MNKIKLILVSIFYCYLSSINIFGNNNLSNEILLVKDIDSCRTKFFLKENNIILDSLIIKYVDFSFDSMQKINDTTIHYMYSTLDSPFDNLKLIIQKVLMIKDGRLIVSFVSTYSSQNLPNDTLKYGFFWRYNNNFCYNSNLSESYVEYEYFRYDINEDDFSIDSTKAKVPLLFDQNKRIFYSEIDTLNGDYSFRTTNYHNSCGSSKIESDEQVQILEEQVFRLNIGKNSYFYYKNNWFTVTEYPTWSLIKLFW